MREYADSLLLCYQLSFGASSLGKENGLLGLLAKVS